MLSNVDKARRQQFGKRLRTIRAARRMKQQELAAAIGVTAAALSFWEAGSRWPDGETLARVAQCLDIDVTWLTKDEEVDPTELRSMIPTSEPALKPKRYRPPLSPEEKKLAQQRANTQRRKTALANARRAKLARPCRQCGNEESMIAHPFCRACYRMAFQA